MFNLLFFGELKQTYANNHSPLDPVEAYTLVSSVNNSSTEDDERHVLVFPDASLFSHGNFFSDSSIKKIIDALPDLGDFFSIPAAGWNWGQLHYHNGVDIANSCGNPIYASAEGIVAEAKEGWNEGYGSYIIINHANNTSTRYAHNKKNLAQVGQYVLRGDLIAYIGNTGMTHGPTGCHLHFEVKGARNPFVKK